MLPKGYFSFYKGKELKTPLSAKNHGARDSAPATCAPEAIPLSCQKLPGKGSGIDATDRDYQDLDVDVKARKGSPTGQAASGWFLPPPTASGEGGDHPVWSQIAELSS